MEDLRTKNKLMVKGHCITAGYEVNEETVNEMLQLMGVEHDTSMVQEAIGFLSKNGMEFDMNNLYEFLKSKQILSRKDYRGLKKN